MVNRKLPRNGGTSTNLALGHWSNPWKWINADQVPQKIRVLLQDKLIARGRFVDLYLPVSSTTSGVVLCSCVKDTTDQAERACSSCYGTKYAPGYLKFLHQTIFFATAEFAGFTLTNTERSTTWKPHRLVLGSAATTGTIVTPDKAYTNNAVTPEDWAVKLEAFRPAAGQTVALEFSTNGGGAWTNIVLTEVPSPGHGFTGTIPGASLAGTGNIRFRVTLTRASVADQSPYFEIVRTRRVRTENESTYLIGARTDHVSGRILILRPWVQESEALEAGRGRLVDHMGDRTWTVPLDFFDTSLSRETESDRIQDYFGPHAFYELGSGVMASNRYVLIRAYVNENLGIFTHQYFDDRRAQASEGSYGLVW